MKRLLFTLILLSALLVAAWVGWFLLNEDPPHNYRLTTEQPSVLPADLLTFSDQIQPAYPAADPDGAASGISGATSFSYADILAGAGDLSDPAERKRVVAAMEAMEIAQRERVREMAEALGLPLRIEAEDGTVQELMGFEDGRPIYYTTHNDRAAITTGVHWLQAEPYELDGEGGVIGVWDSGIVRTTHREFEGRVENLDSNTITDHATHVAGTLVAAGIDSRARGMAPKAGLDAYDWQGDKSEMTSRGASYPGEPGSIYLSNHSYGGVAGWNRTSGSNNTVDWQWFGEGTSATAVDSRFGRYTNAARDSDAIANNLPYYLMFRSAGNDRNHNPTDGSMVDLAPANPNIGPVAYDPDLHPPGDGLYLNGYNTISFDGIAKNVVTVGAVNDAVIAGSNRHLPNATMTNFSSWGPTNDGRIKPDLVANGAALYSTGSGGNTSYSTLSGTSMSAPNATGSAMLLVQKFDRLFPGQVMRASTLKGLLIHTADDRGTPGPNYQFGWGLINSLAAVEVIETYHSQPVTRALIEDRIHPDRPERQYEIHWDGESPIRATLSWTDPPVSNPANLALRSPHLVNDLDLIIEGPDGEIYFPYVMPFVGDWSEESLDLPATTGVNRTDNVEQVFIAEPTVAGIYTATVSYHGVLTNNVQNFSLILSGGGEGEPSSPQINSVSPESGLGGPLTFTITGEDLLLGAEVSLVFGAQEIPLHGIEASGDRLRARLHEPNLMAVSWDLRVINPDGQVAEFPSAYTVLDSLYWEDFEGDVSDWTAGGNWGLSTNSSNSPTHAMFSPSQPGSSIQELISPAIHIPDDIDSLRFSFWHQFNLLSGVNGGVLEIAVNEGSWVDVTESSTGLEFMSGGYNGQVRSSGRLLTRNPLGNRNAWSGNTAGSFRQVVIDFNDLENYRGAQIRFRWRLGVSPQTSSLGWYIDDVVLSATQTQENLPPTIVEPAQAGEEIVEGQSVELTVLAEDDTGESALVYTWSVDDDFEFPVQFSDNATNSASQTTAVFSKVGVYHFQVVVRDPEGLTASSSVEVEVVATPTAVQLAPESAELAAGESLLFTASLQDQFGHPMEIPEEGIVWQAEGGQIDYEGLFVAGFVDGEFFVMATIGEVAETALVNVQGLFTTGSLPELQFESVLPDTLRFQIAAGMPPGEYVLEWSATLSAESWQVLESYEFDEVTEATVIAVEFPGEGFLRLRYISLP